MFYDLNVDESFKDFDEIKKSQIDGCCIARSKLDNLKNINLPVLVNTDACKIYSRINLDYENKLDQSTMARLKVFDIICIKNVDNTNISSVIKLNPDLINLKIESLKHIKKSFINTLKEKDIYLELTLRDALYTSKDRIMWMNALRRLIKLGCGKVLVISSGARCFTELKRPHDIAKMLNIFGLSDDKVKQILHNSEIVLRKAAMLRYTFNNTIANSVDEGNLKKDFVIDYL